MDAGIKKIIEFIRRTGDRFVVLETESQEPYVIMPFEAYEQLVNDAADSVAWPEPVSESELLEKINHDIALWRSHHEGDEAAASEPLETAVDEDSEGFDELKDLPEVPPAAQNAIQPVEPAKPAETEDEKYYFEPVAG